MKKKRTEEEDLYIKIVEAAKKGTLGMMVYRRKDDGSPSPVLVTRVDQTITVVALLVNDPSVVYEVLDPPEGDAIFMLGSKQHTLPQFACPWCQTINDTARGLKRPPRQGDIAVCVACGQLSIFEDDKSVRIPTEDEREIILRNPDIVKSAEAFVEAAARVAAERARLKRETEEN